MILDELDTLRAAAERDDRIAVMASTERLDVAFQRYRLRSQRFDTMATLLEQRIDGSDDDARDSYREAIVELEQRWINLDRSTLAYVQDETLSTALIESADAVGEAYQMYQERTVTLEAAVSDVSASSLIVLCNDPTLEIPKGATVDAEVILSVIGRSHSDSIAIDVESEMSTSVSPSILEGLDENETVTIRVELSSSTADRFDVFVTATGETNTDRTRFTALVLAKRDYVVRAGQLVGSLETMLDSMKDRKRQNGLENQVQTLQRRLISISDDLEKQRRPVRSIDSQLSAARNSVVAIEREISTSESSVDRQEILYITREILELIGNAIEALS